VTRAIAKVLATGKVTEDLKPEGLACTTNEVGEALCTAIG